MANDEISSRLQILMGAADMFPGWSFSPTDEELVSFYLKKKLEGSEKRVQIIEEIEIYKYEPWDLPVKSAIHSEDEWFFFSPRRKKYPNGNQTRRITEIGYWKVTGKEHDVKSGFDVIGRKRTLVFHIGRAPKGERTGWIMHEYSMKDRFQDFLVCRITRNKDKATDRIKKKKCSSASPSGKQVDSTLESNKKDAAEAESSGYVKDYGSDDIYADILKDDIINLNEFQLYTTSDQPSKIYQGTANRRIRFIKKKGDSDGRETSDSEKMTNKDSSYDKEKRALSGFIGSKNTTSTKKRKSSILTLNKTLNRTPVKVSLPQVALDH